MRLKNIFITTFTICIITQTAYAFSWDNLWFNKNEQGAKLLHQKKPEAAAKRFSDHRWRGVAHYRAGDYEQALNEFKQNNTAIDYYNQGNTFAYLGQYQAALDTYQQALKLLPDFADAKYNYDIIKKLLEKDKENQKQQNEKNKNNNQKQQQQASQQKNNKKDKNPNKQPEEKSGKNQAKNQQQKNEAKNKQTSKQNKQSQNQWLRQIPDDPGGLLQQKFLRDHLKRKT